MHANNTSSHKNRWRNVTLALSIIALILSIAAIFLSVGGVRVEITHESYIGTIVTLLGIIVTMVLGFQIINYLSFENKANNIIQDKLAELENVINIHKKELRIDIMLTLFRNSLYAPNWNISLSYLLPAIEDVISINDKHNALIIINLLYKFSIETQIITYNSVDVAIRTKLDDLLSDLKPLLDEDEKVKLTSVYKQILKFIPNNDGNKTIMGNRG